MGDLRNHRHPVRSLEQAVRDSVEASGYSLKADSERLSKLYVRERHLPLLRLGFTSEQIADYSLASMKAIVERLAAALYGAREAMLRGHWTANLARQMALASALLAETKRLEQLQSPAPTWENAGLLAQVLEEVE